MTFYSIAGREWEQTMSPFKSMRSRSTKRPFRKPSVPAHSLRRRLEGLEDRTVPAAVAPPDGLVSWWTGVGVRYLPDGSKERFAKRAGAGLGRIGAPKTRRAAAK
jgi:hypothetical protein